MKRIRAAPTRRRDVRGSAINQRPRASRRSCTARPAHGPIVGGYEPEIAPRTAQTDPLGQPGDESDGAARRWEAVIGDHDQRSEFAVDLDAQHPGGSIAKGEGEERVPVGREAFPIEAEGIFVEPIPREGLPGDRGRLRVVARSQDAEPEPPLTRRVHRRLPTRRRGRPCHRRSRGAARRGLRRPAPRGSPGAGSRSSIPEP